MHNCSLSRTFPPSSPPLQGSPTASMPRLEGNRKSRGVVWKGTESTISLIDSNINIMNASLYQTEQSVKVLVVSDSDTGRVNDYFDINVVPFSSMLHDKINHISFFNGDPCSLLITTKPDVVIVNSDKVLTELLRRHSCPQKTTVKSVSILKGFPKDGKGGGQAESSESSSSNSGIIKSNMLEINGHVCFVFSIRDINLPYGLYLFIDQLKTLKSKLNID